MYNTDSVAAETSTLKEQMEINARCTVPHFVWRCSKCERSVGLAHVFCSREAAPQSEPVRTPVRFASCRQWPRLMAGWNRKVATLRRQGIIIGTYPPPSLARQQRASDPSRQYTSMSWESIASREYLRYRKNTTLENSSCVLVWVVWKCLKTYTRYDSRLFTDLFSGTESTAQVTTRYALIKVLGQ